MRRWRWHRYVVLISLSYQMLYRQISSKSDHISILNISTKTYYIDVISKHIDTYIAIYRKWGHWGTRNGGIGSDIPNPNPNPTGRRAHS